MNKQEIFDECLNKMRAQGKPGMHATKTCAYLAKDGSKCAIGILLTQEQLEKVKDYVCSVTALPKEILQERFGDLDVKERRFLADLQHAHDAAVTKAEYTDEPWLACFEQNMQDLAQYEGLVYNAL